MAYQHQYVIGQHMQPQQQVQVHHPDPTMHAAQLELAGHPGGPAHAAATLATRRPFDPTAHDLDAHVSFVSCHRSAQ